MAQDDSRWQDLMKMQETANSATNPASDQPSGQFNADDIEFESFMFDTGTGPLPTLGSLNTDPNMGVVTAVNPLAANLAAHTGSTGPLGGGQAPAQTPAQAAQPDQPAPAAPGFDFSGQNVPLPPFLAGMESQPQQQAEPEPLFQPYQSSLHAEQSHDQQQTAPPAAPRGTGPLGSQHSSSNLAARLSQLQGQQGTDGAPSGTMPRGTGPLGMRGGTGPLGGMPSTGTGSLRTPASASTAGAQAESESAQTSPAGPINPAYFKTPTGPLGQRLRTGPLNPANLRPEPEEAPAVPAPMQAATFAMTSTYTEQVQNDPTTWNDITLSSVDDFSQVLLALYGLPANLPPVINEAPAAMAAMSAGTAVQERPDTTQEWAGLPFEDAYSASAGPALAEPAVAGAEEAPVPGWGEMTGAPPENNYTSTLDEVAAPGYDGPQLDYVVPLDEAEAQAQAPETVAGGTSAGDALEFDSFMFDDGHPSQLLDPSVLESQQPAPTTTASGMDAFLQPPDEFDMEPLQYGTAPAETQAQAPTATTPEATQAEAEMEPATDDAGQGPLPFWLQDTSDLEVLARQGYVDMDLGTGTQDATEDRTTPAQTAESLAPPAPVELEQEARVATPDELTGVTAEDTTEPSSVAPADLEPAAEEGFTQAEEFDVAPFDASMTAPSVEAEVPGDEAELELAPTFQTDTYAGPQAELEAEPALELEAEPAVEVAAQAEADVPADEPYYADLPPIEPFDFTSLGLAPEEDAYGFNTEELLGVLPPTHDPMRATADLDVLADIFDGTPAGNLDDMNTTFSAAASLDATPTTQNAQRTPTSPALSQLTSPIASFLEPEEDVEETATQSQLQAQLRAQMEAQAQAATQPEPLAEVEPVEPAEPVAPQPPRRETGRLGGGWTSAVTTTLSMGGIDDDLDIRGTEAQETGLLFEPPVAETVAAQPTAVQPAAPEPLVPQSVAEPVAEPVAAAQEAPADPGFDIEPFDYSQLRLEEEQEIPTGMLDPRKARRPGTTGELISPDPGGSLWSERPAAPAEEPEDDEESWQGTERDTSLFMSTSRPASDRGKSTGWLTDDAAPLEEPARLAAALPATPAPTPAPEAAATPEPEVEAQTETTRGRGRKKGAADDSSAVKARVSWADATSPGLPTLPDSQDLQGMTTGPLGQEEPEVEDVEATVPQGSKQTRALKPTPDMVPEPALDVAPDVAPETPAEPEPKRPRGRAATAATSAPAPQAAPVETPAVEPVQEVDTVEDVTPAATPVAAEAPVPAVPTTPSVAPTPTATPVPVEVPEYTYQPMQGQQETSQQVEMPKVGDGRSMYTSGPLPELEGFEALRQLVEANPDDIGAHMALAAGYSQLGDLSTTLRVYRRVLRKRNVPPMFLSLIAEELNDYEREMQGDAHYHQVRGDLYMKQGRHQEAIQEYNKIS
ncbi:MAG: hypothetical protein M3437_04920 [Chloroflexota bacterium]|nr:hypothetical protein [Chloroflexota bacterium]MDQ5866534.1 hypothetical protein [Chloroflexota bacterium]